MIQSTNYSLANVIYMAVEKLRIPDVHLFGITDQMLIDEAHSSIMEWFTRAIPIVREQYRVRTPVSGYGTGSNVYATSGIAYTALTNQLSVSGQTFTTAYIGMSVLIINGSSYYRGSISGRVSNTIVTIAGTEIPTTDIASATAVAIWARSSSISLASLNLAEIVMKDDVPINIALESDLLGDIQFISNARARDVIGRLSSYPNGVFATLYADTINLIQGASISSVGNLVLVAIVNPQKQATITANVYVPDGYCPTVIDILTQRIAGLIGRQMPPLTESKTDAAVQAFVGLKEDTK